MHVFALRCPWLHNNRPVVALPLWWRWQHPISAVEKVVMEPMTEAVSASLPISIESIRLFFFIKSTRKNWGKQNSYPPVCPTPTVTWRPGKNVNLMWFTFLLLNSLLFLFFIFGVFHTVRRMKIGNNSSNGDRNTDFLPVNPSSLFTGQRLQVSYQNLDTIFDNYYYKCNNLF